MAQYTLQNNPISIRIDEDTVARPIMRRSPVISANSLVTQIGKPRLSTTSIPSVKVLWPDNNTPATSDDKFVIQVTFTVKSGGGTIDGQPASVTVQPDANGVASLQNWTLGNLAGDNIVEAVATITGNTTLENRSTFVGGGSQTLVGGPVVFTATAIAGILNVDVLPVTNTVSINNTVALKAVASLEPGAVQPTWSWSSSNPTIASVVGDTDTAIVTGRITGNVTITATATSGNSKRSGTATVTVVEQEPDPQISLSTSPVTVNIIANGSTATTAIQIGRTNYTGNVILTAQGLPAGVTGIFSPPSTTSVSSTLTFTAPIGTPVGQYTVQINGSGNDVNDATTTVTLNVSAPTTDTTVCIITEVIVTPDIPVSMNVGDTITVTGTARGTNCTSQQLGVRYSSSNTAVATVSANGSVTARSVGNTVITATSTTDGTKNASVAIIVQEPPLPPTPPAPEITWRSCDGETHDGNPPAGYVSATYLGAGNGICWEPVSIVGFEPDLNTALLFEYQRDSDRLPPPVVVTARNPSQAITYRLTLRTNEEIEITPSTFTVGPQSTQKFTVVVTKPLLDKLADGNSDIGLNIDIQQT